MLHNLAAGSGLVALTVLIHTVGLVLIASATPWLARQLGFHNHNVGRTLVMTGTVLGILAILTVEVWIWGLAYTALHATPDFVDALVLSTAMFSTIGYGEIQIDPTWRLLTALEGINGFLMIGWSTAYLVGVATRHGPFRQGEHF
ncbi:MAG TPA: ion channel [Rhizomicrobium sp.]|nr:ion channel [Rhizomicrobium sp.]